LLISSARPHTSKLLASSTQGNANVIVHHIHFFIISTYAITYSVNLDNTKTLPRDPEIGFMVVTFGFNGRRRRWQICVCRRSDSMAGAGDDGDRGCRWLRQWRGGQRDAAAVMPPTELGIVGSGKLDAHYMYVHDQYFTHTTRLQHFR
jgi:hypothetical protein